MLKRVKISVVGAVQGVGFRPFIYRLAKKYGLAGFVKNTTSGVLIEAEGEESFLISFIEDIISKKPYHAKIYAMDYVFTDARGYEDFRIEKSEACGSTELVILCDIATCSECLNEMYDENNRRRYMYPFINCTLCGPRYTIIKGIPYDRKNTSMSVFEMCKECEAEYNNPDDRRFHAQPNACWNCGPDIWVSDGDKTVAGGREALDFVADKLGRGCIVAVKGIGGFHIMCDALNDHAVKKLRDMKKRLEKPFAVMFPDIDAVKKHCLVSDFEEAVLKGVERPIVLLKYRKPLSKYVSMELNTCGAFLPYSPVHHIILNRVRKPLVATSANVTDEPIIKDNDEIIEKFKGLCDYFLLHNREIVRRCDDSVVMCVSKRRVMIRRARGFAPIALKVPFKFDGTVLALGGYLKNTIALAFSDKVYVSQHIGDLDNYETQKVFEDTVYDFLKLFNVDPDVVVIDKHPRYYSSSFAYDKFGDRCIIKVQHHVAHAVSCAVEAELDADFIGVTFDGTGLGDDGSIWGGEIFVFRGWSYERVFTLAPLGLPGSDAAIKEPYRIAVYILETIGEPVPESFKEVVGERELNLIAQMIRRRVNMPFASSIGRLFDAASSLCGLAYKTSYEAQAAMLFEDKCLDIDDKYMFDVKDGIVDYRPVFKEMVCDIKSGVPVGVIAAKFHNAICDFVVRCCEAIRERYKLTKVVLSGGVFQNRFLLGRLINLLEEKGYSVFVNQLVPVNDGGLSLGQAVLGHMLWRRQCV